MYKLRLLPSTSRLIARLISISTPPLSIQSPIAFCSLTDLLFWVVGTAIDSCFRYYYPVASGISYSDTNIHWDTGAYDANATQPLLTYPRLVKFKLIAVQCIHCTSLTRIEVSLLSPLQDISAPILATYSECINRKLIPHYQVFSPPPQIRKRERERKLPR